MSPYDMYAIALERYQARLREVAEDRLAAACGRALLRPEPPHRIDTTRLWLVARSVTRVDTSATARHIWHRDGAA